MGHESEEWGLESVDPSHASSGNSSFKRVVQKINSNTKCRFCLWIIALWCAATVVFMLIGFDEVVDKVAVGQMVLHEGGGRKYEAWKSAPMPVYYKVTVFNLTNPNSFMAGARPRLDECGPYVYRMVEEKLNITFHNNFSVSYRTKPTYIFVPSLSGGVEDDLIWTVNIPLINAADAVKDQQFFRTVIQVAQKIHGFKTLRQLKVRELLWGYDSHVMNWARTLQDLPYPHAQFGLLVGFNNTPQEPYTMYTGASNSSFMNAIYAWNHKTKLDFWSGEYCNKIRGTDASGFHPNVKPSDKLFIFNGQLCRSLPLVFDKKVQHKNIEAYRFVPPPDTFSYGPESPQNSCFCSKGGCPRRGLLDMKPCYYGAAVAFSFPHFFQADPVLKHVVQGLRPDPELHQTQFDIYPKLGIPLRVKLRMQMNVVLDAGQALQRARHFDIIFPVFWFEAGIDSLPGDMVGMLKMAQNLPPFVKTTSVVICASLTIIFLVLLLVSAFAGMCGVVSTPSRSATPEHLPEQAPPRNPKGIAPLPVSVKYPYHQPFPPPSYNQYGNQIDTIDGPHYKITSEDPPEYTSKPTTNGSSSSIISAEVHTSASEDNISEVAYGSPVIPDDQRDFQPTRSSTDTVDEFYSGEEPIRVTPTTPPGVAGSSVVAPLAKSENVHFEEVLNQRISHETSKEYSSRPAYMKKDSAGLDKSAEMETTSGATGYCDSPLSDPGQSPKHPPPLESDL